MIRKAIFPGSFDPFHQGHLDIIRKASKLFDSLYVIVSINPEKNTESSFSARKKFIENQVSNLKNVQVLINSNEFTANVAKKLNVQYLIRSARDDIDFDYELELAAANFFLNQGLETILFIPSYEKINYKSRLLKQQISKEK